MRRSNQSDKRLYDCNESGILGREMHIQANCQSFPLVLSAVEIFTFINEITVFKFMENVTLRKFGNKTKIANLKKVYTPVI